MLVVVEKEMGSYPIEGLFGSISLCVRIHTLQSNLLLQPPPFFLPSFPPSSPSRLFPYFLSFLPLCSCPLPLLCTWLSYLPCLPTPPHFHPSPFHLFHSYSPFLLFLPTPQLIHILPLHWSPLLLLSLPFQHHSLFSASSSPATADILERLLLTQ